MHRRDAWGKTDAATRANILLKIADRLEANLELLAYAETVDNGKAIRENPERRHSAAVDHFRYFAGCVRAQEGALPTSTKTPWRTTSGTLGVVGQIIPWNFPILMAAWKLARPGRWQLRRVLKPAEAPHLHPDPGRADCRPAATRRAEHRQRLWPRSRHALATSKRIAKIAFLARPPRARVIAQAAANNLIPPRWNWAARAPTSSLPTSCPPRTTAFLDKAMEGWPCCSRSTRAKSAPAPPRADPGIDLRRSWSASQARGRHRGKAGPRWTPTP